MLLVGLAGLGLSALRVGSFAYLRAAYSATVVLLLAAVVALTLALFLTGAQHNAQLAEMTRRHNAQLVEMTARHNEQLMKMTAKFNEQLLRMTTPNVAGSGREEKAGAVDP